MTDETSGSPDDDLHDDDLHDEDVDDGDLDDEDLDDEGLDGLDDDLAADGLGDLDGQQLDAEQLDAEQLDAEQLDAEQLDAEQLDALADAEQAMNEARARLSEVPAEVVVTNHVMGLYELAAIHLSASPPDLRQSALAIDAVACLVDGLGERLGDDHATMQDALNNIRLAFVQIKGQTRAE